jgi:hypothetical protein
MAWDMLWEETVSTQLIFGHLQGTNMSYRFKQTKELGAGDKGMHKQSSHRCGLLGVMTGGASIGQAGDVVGS